MSIITALQILPLLVGLEQLDYIKIEEAVIEKRDARRSLAIEEEDALPEASLYSIPENVPDEIELLLIKYSARYSLPLDVVVRLSEVESNHGAFAQSAHPNYDGSVDIGVLALNSNFIDYYAKRYFEGDASVFDPYNPEHNIQTGLAYLAHLNKLTGDLTSAVTAYNCGYKTMQRGNIPTSTQRYVRAVLHGESL